MARDKRITEASLNWRITGDAASQSGDGTAAAPSSVLFNDIYFAGDGEAETAHVFLQGNDLPARFETGARFTIGELGFGTGLNFLSAWRAWNAAAKPPGARLHFFSVEAYPLSIEDMARAHANWPSLERLAAALRGALPPPQPGFHQAFPGADVCLTLYYGDALDGLRQAEARVDAWFFDGFSPAKNPAMWAPDLFAEAARLSAQDATCATFTVAGAVRRALQGAGFAVEKRPGFGRKREMLTGRLDMSQPPASRRKPWFDTRRARTLAPGSSVAIIGAGVAGASLAHALKGAGLAPTVYEATTPASGASGNPAGLVMPRLDADDTPAGRFHAEAYLHAVRLLQDLQTRTRDPLFNPCGVLMHARDEKERVRQEKLIAGAALPEGWMAARPEGLFFPQGGVAAPPAYVQALLEGTPLRPEVVLKLTKPDDAWRVHTERDADRFDAVVFAGALGSLRFVQMRSIPLSGSVGQVDYFPDAPAPACAHAFGPYAAPAPGGGTIIGATYAPFAPGAALETTRKATLSNLHAIGDALPDMGALSADAALPRASVRCVTPDRAPVVGPVPAWGFYSAAYDDLRKGAKREYPPGEVEPGLYVLSGLGSRGLVTAPLAAAMLAAEMTGAPAPVDRAVSEALHPARFFIRDLKRARPVRPAGPGGQGRRR